MNQVSVFYYCHNSNIKPHHINRNRIPYFDLTIVQSGVLCYMKDDVTLTLNPGDFILLRPGEVRQRLDSQVVSSYFSFNFYTDLNLTSVPTVTSGAITPEILSLLSSCDYFYNRIPDHYSEKIAYLLGSLLLYFRDTANNAQMNPLALEIKNYILSHYTEPITLQGIAERFHFSVSYCNGVFKKEMKKPIVDFLIEERIRKAKELLIHTTLSLPIVALKTGYSDYNYFSRLFKKHTRYTPSQFRVLYAKELK